MERLTIRKSDFAVAKRGSDAVSIFQAIDRLADIEDILGDDYDLDRLRELVEADRDGRCVVLPVKIGTHVWSTVFCRLSDDGKEHPTFPWEFSVSMMDEWGTGWHLTEKDAEKALEGETHDNSL